MAVGDQIIPHPDVLLIEHKIIAKMPVFGDPTAPDDKVNPISGHYSWRP